MNYYPYICINQLKQYTMLLSEAKSLAIELMNLHGLLDKGWSFEFDNAKRRFGCCRYGSKRITLSKALVSLNDEARVKNTILHEIAHALVGHGHGHDIVWKRIAMAIGCDGNRCFSSKNTQLVEANYQAVCKKCGHTHNRHRLPKRASSCGACSNKFDANNLLVFKNKEERKFAEIFG
jgi:predicted SprT family Zn-dependent metalloprotease